MSLHSPSLGPASPSPSSSQVTIPIPGKSILKRPPAPQAGLFSRLSRFLPGESAPAPASAQGEKEREREEERVLKRAHFILPEIAVVYPISSLAPPSTPTLRDEKRAIEERERERRRRVVRSNSLVSALSRSNSLLASPALGNGNGSSPTNGSADNASIRSASAAGNGTGTGNGKGEEGEWWAMDKVESFYRECCEGCQEPPDPGIMRAFKTTPPTHPRTVDFSGVQLTFASASILADVLSIEWGLRKVVFKECDLDELTLKPLLHALLIPRSLAYLSLASNRRLTSASAKTTGGKGGGAWRVVGAYVGKAHSLTFLDLSQNALDKKAVECVVAALGEYRGLVSLKLDDCSLRAAALETLSRAVRTSSLRNISLRHNRISPTGAVALALMIRDYPDVLAPPPAHSATHPHPASHTPAQSPALPAHVPAHLQQNQNHTPPGSPTLTSAGLGSILGGGGKLPPPPRHPAATITAAQTTYTPYVPRRRQQSVPAPAPQPGAQREAVVASSVLGGVTARHVPGRESPVRAASGMGAAADKEREREREKERERERDGPSAALLDKVRALDALPRVGALRTLDLKGNDLRTGITYIAQVLKRNRTLKVLNLAENKLDVACLVSLAEALKYNSSLETLDLSRNPCSGPGLEGIQSLRTAFTLNTALKRLFLSATGMQSPGAIALAEFLPESASLLHLDLTENALGVAGVLALSKGVEANFVMRCLDLNIPPGDEACARMCRDILNACVRNTEEAERAAVHGGGGGGSGTQTPVGNGASAAGGNGNVNVNGNGNGVLAGPGSGRGLAKGVWGMIEESELAKSIRLDEEKKIESDVAVRARACIAQLEAMLAPPPPPASPTTAAPAAPPPSPADVLKQARALTRELGNTIQTTEDPSRMEELLGVNDELTALVARAPAPGRPTLTLQGLGLKWTPGAPLASPAPEDGSATLTLANGHAAVEEEDHTPTTPRVDKGKARAVPEPEEPEKVLSPMLLLGEDEDDEDRMRFSPVEEGDDDGEPVMADSPTHRSRSWVEEEGEVFRKGTVLLGPEEMDGEYAGEDLRKELLEAMVERPPPRPLTDQFGIEIPEQEQQQQQQEEPPAAPQPASPVVDKPPPRPYISRSRSSSSSIMSMISPTISSFTSAGGQIPEATSPRTPSSPAAPSPLGAGARPYLPRTRSSSSSTIDNR
ncbi:hypothetical protein DFH07DRAFT_1032273 [Mycena maculata]|uniref:RNI-like protein n=1 Tax=Mycena maculata TaxID=230809 RepID=A0AAD7NA70_9AGAR|nr:hypothetical protein DFH07DRAFT_1032273 [Mycena maculata]